MRRRYAYVGPPEIREAQAGVPEGAVITHRDALLAWCAAHAANADAEGLWATFVIVQKRELRLAPRRSEHVACAGGRGVFAAGEICFDQDGDVLEISNQSTG